jgi:elongation factor P
MNINSNDLKKGDVLLMDDKLYVCMKAESRAMGRKMAFCQAVMRNLKDGTQKDIKFTASEKLEKVDLFEKTMQYLYSDGDMFHFMDTKTFDQIEIGTDFIGDKAPFLTEEMTLNMTFYEEAPIAIKLPQTMEFEIVEADPEIKKSTASAQFKSGTLSNGVGVKIPGFINAGDWIKINTETMEYQERVKK